MTVTGYWCEYALVGGEVRSGVAIEVVDGRFASVAPGVARPGAATVLRGMTIPGLANAHSHAFHRALRSRVQRGGGSFWTWRDVMYRAAARLDPDSYHRLAIAVFAEMACAGVTTVGEFHYVHHQPDGTPYGDPNAMGAALFAAATEAGIRVTLLDTLYLHGGLSAGGYQPVEGAQLRYRDATAEAWCERVEALTSGAGHRVAAALHSVRATDPVSIAEVASWAATRGLVLHAHVSEQTAENASCRAAHGATPTEVLDEAGALGPRFTAVHATHVVADDVERLGRSGSFVCMCPTTERDLGDGIGPSSELVAAGVALTIGSDSHAMIDLFEEARAVELDERLRMQRRGIHTAGSLLSMATANGHRSLGWDDAGAIEVGMRADLVTVTLDSIRTAGPQPDSAVETVVFAATASDVTDVIVDGRTVVAGGHHTTIDVGRELGAAIGALLDGDATSHRGPGGEA